MTTFIKRRSRNIPCDLMTVVCGWAMFSENGRNASHNAINCSYPEHEACSGMRSECVRSCPVCDAKLAFRCGDGKCLSKMKVSLSPVPDSDNPRPCPITGSYRCVTVTRTAREPRTRLAARTTAAAPATSSECGDAAAAMFGKWQKRHTQCKC